MGASLSKLIQAVSWQTEMGARIRLLCLCVVCPLVLGARGRPSYLSTCLSPGDLREALGRVQGKACQWSLSRVWGRTATVSMDTYAWTKLHTKIISWVSGRYECRLCMALTWSDLNHRDRNLYCSSTYRQGLSCHAYFNFSRLRFGSPTRPSG